MAELARERGVAGALSDRLMRAYWAEDRDISDPEVLADEAAAFGIDPDEAREVAATHPYQERIQALTSAVYEMGGQGVPAFVIADKVLIPGAQPHELFEKAIARISRDR